MHAKPAFKLYHINKQSRAFRQAAKPDYKLLTFPLVPAADHRSLHTKWAVQQAHETRLAIR
jgi:hypothetical protein